MTVVHRTPCAKRSVQASFSQQSGVLNRLLRFSVPMLLVGQFVEVKLLEGLGLPCGCADAVTRGIGLFKRAPERVGLFRRRKEFELGDQFHAFSVLKGCVMYRHTTRRGTSSAT